MFAIETFTAQADVVEDRIRLDAISPDGQAVSILLTRRLADRFLPLFVAAIEQGGRPGIPRAIELAMAQQQLRQQRAESPLPDVVLPQGAGQWLARTIHLETRSEDLVWTLTDDAENAAAMALPGDGPRAVLDILLLMYRQLEWGEGLFPEWLIEDDAPDQSARVIN